MVQRQHDLQQMAISQRAYALPCSNKASVTYQIQLRVVREFGLPDSTVEVLQGASVYQTEENPMLLAEAMYNTPRHHKSAAGVKQGSPHTLSPTVPTCSPTEVSVTQNNPKLRPHDREFLYRRITVKVRTCLKCIPVPDLGAGSKIIISHWIYLCYKFII